MGSPRQAYLEACERGGSIIWLALASSEARPNCEYLSQEVRNDGMMQQHVSDRQKSYGEAYLPDHPSVHFPAGRARFQA